MKTPKPVLLPYYVGITIAMRDYWNNWLYTIHDLNILFMKWPWPFNNTLGTMQIHEYWIQQAINSSLGLILQFSSIFFWITCLISSKRFANLGQFHLLLFCAKIASLHGLDLYLHFISILNVCWKRSVEFRSTLQNKDMTLCNLKIWKCTSFNL